MKIEIGKFIYESDGTILVIKKNNGKEISNDKITDIEITFYLPAKTFSRVPSLYFVTPNMTVPHASINRKDNGEIRMLHDFLVEHGAVEQLRNMFIAASAKHSSVKEKLSEERNIKKEEKYSQREQQKIIKRNQAIQERQIASKRAGCKEKTEEKYTCLKCGEVWYASAIDVLKNIHNATRGTTYNTNQVRDLSKCPKCGSGASKHKTVKYWVDKKGNCVDRED